MVAAAFAPGLSWAQQEMQRQSEAFSLDPLAYFIQMARKVGIVSLISGIVLGIVGYYLKAAATGAMNNEASTLQDLANIFGNIKPLTFKPSPTGTAPLSFSTAGVQNFFNDAWTDVKALAGDAAQIGQLLGTLGEDTAIALVDLAKVGLGFVMHFPDILWNALVWGVGGSLADIINWVFPWLLILGGGLIFSSLVAQGVRWAWRSTIGAAWQESSAEWAGRARGRVKARFDRILGNPRPEAAKPSSGAPGPEISHETPPPEPSTPALEPGRAVPGVPATEAASVAGEAPTPASALAAPPSEPTPEPPAGPLEVKVVELPPGQLTEPELEEALGKAFVEARDAHKSGRVMPEPIPEPPKRQRTVREILTVA